MKQRKIGLIAIVAIGLAAAVFFFWKTKQNATVVLQASVQAGFQQSTVLKADTILNCYYNLKDAFVKEDTVLIAELSKKLKDIVNVSDSIDYTKDTLVQKNADLLLQSIAAELIALNGETQWAAKQRSFQFVSEVLYDYLKTIQYSGGIVFRQYCPMAFDNEGAIWLSNKNAVVNPYFGTTMLHCGSVLDSLHYQP